MKKRILKTSAFLLALLLIAGVGWFANALVGNPISKWMATRTAKAYLAETYPEERLTLERVSYSFKDSNYHAFVSTPGSIDGDFSLWIDMWGTLRGDSYHDRVETGWNTADRLSREYRDTVDAVLDSVYFFRKIQIGYGDLAFVPREYQNDPSAPSYALVTEDLVRNAIYDIADLGAKAGVLTLYLEEEEVSPERMADYLKAIDRRFAGSANFYAVDLVLEHPKSEDGSQKDDRLEIRGFLHADIYDEGLAERVKAAIQATEDYYAAQDAEKFRENPDIAP